MTEIVGTVFAVVFTTAFVVFFVMTRLKSKRQRGALPKIAALLHGQITATNTVAGAFHGIPITYSFVVRGSGSSRESWTEITASIPDQYPLAIYLRREGLFDRGKIEKGTMTDVTIGDIPFDARFVVEAAPAAVVRELLDPRTRSFLYEMNEVELETITKPDGGRAIQLSVERWMEDMVQVERAIYEHARLASRVRDAFTAVAPAQSTTGGDPFRDAVVERMSERDGHYDEVARLEERRRRRFAASRLFWGAIMVTFGIGWIAFMFSRL